MDTDPGSAITGLDELERSLTEYVQGAKTKHPPEDPMLMLLLEEWLDLIAAAKNALMRTPNEVHRGG